jgi:hypothetical protein
MCKNVVEPEGPQMRTRQRVTYSIIKATRAQAYAHARAPTHTNKWYVLLFHGNSGLLWARQCYIRALPVLFHKASQSLEDFLYRDTRHPIQN